MSASADCQGESHLTSKLQLDISQALDIEDGNIHHLLVMVGRDRLYSSMQERGPGLRRGGRLVTRDGTGTKRSQNCAQQGKLFKQGISI
jgi:hypothetical protein